MIRVFIVAISSNLTTKTKNMNLQKSLKDFATLPFKNAAIALFQNLGYHSTINQIDPDILDALKCESVSELHFLFQLTDDEIQAHSATFRSSESAVNNSIIQSYLFFAFELNEVQYSRTTLANLVREVNKQFATPALILFKYNDLLTLAIIHRRLNKKDSEQDVLEKVTLIKDINFANPHRAHLDILSSLAFGNISPRPNNFVELHQAWQKILDISVLNKKFYSELAVLFTELVGGTRGKEIFKTTLKLPSVNDDQVLKEFAVRLIGRLLFCWFLQKKTSTAGISLIPKQILSVESLNELAENAENVDFYHVRLEPLFFETLNKPVEQRKPEFQTGDWAHVPFLNGGLFEPHLHDFYDNSCTLNTLSVPNAWLKKLLSFFERYHFTIEENTPLDVQVAIEPEMLGQIFENLLAEINPETGESARKATGSYYTPREIVDYMVDQSLLAYFETQLVDLDKYQLRALFAHGEVSNPFNPSDSSRLLAAIGNIKILDPACGSGAFPMGILQKLTLLLQKLDPDCVIWLNNLLNKIPDATARTFMRQKLEGEKVLWNYTRKLGILRECIYGVDIQPIAIGISRLRCFLSLIVDEKIEDNQANRGIIPLPNLDFKFVCANTLKGISHLNLQLYESKARLQINELAELRGRYLNSQGDEKVDLQAKFQAVQNALLNIVLSWAGKDSELSQLATWKPFSDESCDWFEPFWMFGMEEGFDVVIGNPPYIRQEAIKHLKADLKHFTVFTGTSDLFTYFYETGFNLLKKRGVLAFITSNKWMRAKYGEKLREFFLKNTSLLQLIDFKGKQVFDATVDSNILLFKKQLPDSQMQFLTGADLPCGENHLTPLAQSLLNKKAFVLGDESVHALKAKIEAIGTPLKEWDVQINYGIKTGFNEAFIIDTATKERLCAEDPKSAEIIKPVLRGRDIKRYGYEWAGLWIIATFPALHLDIEAYPAVKKYLEGFGKRLHQSGEQGCRKKTGNQWFETQDQIAYWQEFEKEKVVYPNMTAFLPFLYDEKGFFTNQKCFIITGEYLKYLIAFLNSTLFKFAFKEKFPELLGGTRELSKVFFEYVTVLKISEAEQQRFIQRVEQILILKQRGADTRELENEINAMMFDLYQLTEQEMLDILLETKTSEADRRDIQSYFRRLQRANS